MKRDSSRKNTRILVVEDNPLDYELMELALSTHLKCDVKLARTRAEYEQLLAQGRPDLIVSDSNVVAFDGFTALTIATQQCPEVPFVFCSGAPADDRLRDSKRPGVGWVTKDAGFNGLVAFVKKVLDSRESE